MAALAAAELRMNWQPLFPNRDPRGPSDPLTDQLLREMLLRETLRLSASEASGVTVTPNASDTATESHDADRAVQRGD